MITYLLVISLPTLLAIGVLLLFKSKVTWSEFALLITVPMVLAGIATAVSYEGKVGDTEIWNGQITHKESERVSCNHSYSCHCHTVTRGSGKNRTTSTECDTCYEHSYDVDWNIAASTGESLSIDRVDRQGLETPPRWAQAYVGEPFSSAHSFDNYILANPTNVLNAGSVDLAEYTGLIPAYPEVFDYYRANHFINAGSVPVRNPALWNQEINKVNAVLGPSKQVNLLVVVVKTSDENYRWALRKAWVGGRKNDSIVILGSEDGHKLDWADVMSWSPREDYKVNLRDDLLDVGSLDDPHRIASLIQQHTQAEYERFHMKSVKYLVQNWEMPMGQASILCLILLLIECGLAYWVVINDVTPDERSFETLYSNLPLPPGTRRTRPGAKNPFVR